MGGLTPLDGNNPLLDAWRELVGDDGDDDAVSDLVRFMDAWGRRDELCTRWSWAVPDDAAIAAIVATGPIVDVGAGTGYWAALVAAAGGDIVAYDRAPPASGGNRWCTPVQYFDVQVGDHTATAAHPDRTLLMVWPPQGPFAADTLDAYTGGTVVYVGELGGACADDRFVDLLHRGFEQTNWVPIPRWPQMRDTLTVWCRRPDQGPARSR